jgi:NAD(P)-dependent dehydrogenase (short-subunit alcohol dehydrogenase family)
MPQHSPAPHTVILGGTAGIGLATAARLAADGHAVTVAGRDADRLKRALDRLRAEAPDPEAVQGSTADQSSRADLDELFEAAGPLDHLVLAAPGSGSVGALAGLDLAALAAAFDSKLVSYAHAIQAALPTLAETGSITLVSASSAQSATPGAAGLSAVNGAVEALVPTLALELAPVRVNAVSPGVVQTAWWDRVAPAEQHGAIFESFVPAIPVGRVGRPEEIADVIALLVRNGFMTGAVIPADGGARLRPQS